MNWMVNNTKPMGLVKGNGPIKSNYFLHYSEMGKKKKENEDNECNPI